MIGTLTPIIFIIGIRNGIIEKYIPVQPICKTKYQPGMAMDVCPAELSEEKTKEMQNFAKRVYDELKLEVYGRIDFLMDADGNLFCLEANTLPGMTPTSLLPQEAAAIGMDYGTLCEKIISLAMEKK